MQQQNIQDIQSEQSCQNLTSQQQNSENESEAYTNFIGSQENSEDDKENRALDEDIENYMNKARKKFNLYKYISQPNELLRKEEETKYNINTAVQWKFEKLNESIWNQQMNQEEEGQHKILRPDMSYDYNKTAKENQNSNNNNSKNQEEDDYFANIKGKSKGSHDKVRWQQYFQNDKLVYKKHEDYQQLNDEKYMANVLCDIRPLITNTRNGEQQIVQQYFGQGVASQEKQINRVYNSFFEKERNHILEFSSDFECGNLLMAYKVGPFEYDLVLQNDINTKGYTQWFFFSVGNAKKNTPYTFNIVNMVRKNTLFSQGMKPLVFSTKDFESDKQWWVRDGYDVQYYQNRIWKENYQYTQQSENNTRHYYTLSFKYKFYNENDRVFFSYTYPYSYSKLNEYLDNLEKDEYKKQFINRKLLCKSIAKNNIEVLNITQNSLKKLDKRKGVIFMARQHPGEVTGSWMVEGAIDYLLEDTFEARFLREQCIFKIFPMINVDGVIHGNNRCSLSGADLNRKWKNPNSKLFPEVYHAYHQIRKMNQERNINLVVDFHGHSKKLNAFFYGNSCIKRPEEPKIFPMVVSKHNRAVKFDQCRFKIQPGFDSTARQALQKLVKIKRIYTLEASQYGYMNLIGNKLEFTPYKYKQLGRNVCHVLFLQTFQDYQKELTLRPPLPNLQNKKKKDQNRDYIGEYHERMRKREAKAQKLQNQFKENVKDPNNLVELKVVTSQLKKQEKLKLQKKKEAEELRIAQIEQGLISDNQKEENLESEDSFSGSDSEPSIDGLDTDTYKKVMFKSFTVAQKKKKRSKTIDIKAKNKQKQQQQNNKENKQELQNKNRTKSDNVQKQNNKQQQISDLIDKKQQQLEKQRQLINSDKKKGNNSYNQAQYCASGQKQNVIKRGTSVAIPEFDFESQFESEKKQKKQPEIQKQETFIQTDIQGITNLDNIQIQRYGIQNSFNNLNQSKLVRKSSNSKINQEINQSLNFNYNIQQKQSQILSQFQNEEYGFVNVSNSRKNSISIVQRGPLKLFIEGIQAIDVDKVGVYVNNGQYREIGIQTNEQLIGPDIIFQKPQQSNQICIQKGIEDRYASLNEKRYENKNIFSKNNNNNCNVQSILSGRQINNADLNEEQKKSNKSLISEENINIVNTNSQKPPQAFIVRRRNMTINYSNQQVSDNQEQGNQNAYNNYNQQKEVNQQQIYLNFKRKNTNEEKTKKEFSNKSIDYSIQQQALYQKQANNKITETEPLNKEKIIQQQQKKKGLSIKEYKQLLKDNALSLKQNPEINSQQAQVSKQQQVQMSSQVQNQRRPNLLPSMINNNTNKDNIFSNNKIQINNLNQNKHHTQLESVINRKSRALSSNRPVNNNNNTQNNQSNNGKCNDLMYYKHARIPSGMQLVNQDKIYQNIEKIKNEKQMKLKTQNQDENIQEVQKNNILYNKFMDKLNKNNQFVKENYQVEYGNLQHFKSYQNEVYKAGNQSKKSILQDSQKINIDQYYQQQQQQQYSQIFNEKNNSNKNYNQSLKIQKNSNIIQQPLVQQQQLEDGTYSYNFNPFIQKNNDYKNMVQNRTSYQMKENINQVTKSRNSGTSDGTRKTRYLA